MWYKTLFIFAAALGCLSMNAFAEEKFPLPEGWKLYEPSKISLAEYEKKTTKNNWLSYESRRESDYDLRLAASKNPEEKKNLFLSVSADLDNDKKMDTVRILMNPITKEYGVVATLDRGNDQFEHFFLGRGELDLGMSTFESVKLTQLAINEDVCVDKSGDLAEPLDNPAAIKECNMVGAYGGAGFQENGCLAEAIRKHYFYTGPSIYVFYVDDNSDRIVYPTYFWDGHKFINYNVPFCD